MKNKAPNPGSLEAVKGGCKCPVIDNAYGKGYLGDFSHYGFVFHEDCPMHGARARYEADKAERNAA